MIKTSSKRDFTSNKNLNVNVQLNEYERFLTTKKKIEQIKKIQLFREQKNQKLSTIFILFLHLKKTKKAQFESISINVRNLIIKHEKYLKIIKFEIHKK
jgi:hypothetical protein